MAKDKSTKKRGRPAGKYRHTRYKVVDGVFYPRADGGMIHLCGRCREVEARTHDELVARFGLRGADSFQSICRTCKTKAKRDERARKAAANAPKTIADLKTREREYVPKSEAD